MDQELKNKIDSIVNSTKKKDPLEVKELLLDKHPFITFEKIKSFLHDKKSSEQLYSELKKELPEFFIIIYKEYPIKCGWSKDLDENEGRYYCKALDEYFILSKNKIHYTLVNQNPKFQETIQQHILTIEENCLKNS